MPTLIIPNRICPHCGRNKWYVNIRGMKTCWYKVRATAKRWNKRNKNKIKTGRRLHYIINKDKELAKCIEWQKNNSIIYKPIQEKANLKYRTSSKGIQTRRKYHKKLRDNLDHTYIKRCITQKLGIKITWKDIPQETIEIKYKQLILTRKIKQSCQHKKLNQKIQRELVM